MTCLLLPVGAQALAVDPLIEGAKLCTRHLPRYEREYGIPTHLLSAIASTESGRYHNGLKIRVPWPWTINAEGKGYYFDSKEEAVAAAKKMRARGVQSMDVGCMQVNMFHHSQAFSSLEEAFEPQNNIAYAASFLRNLYQETNSWKEAAGDYHSRTPARGNEYVGMVYDSWHKIIDKLRLAKLQVPSTGFAEAPAATAVVASAPAAPNYKVMRLPEQKGKQVAAYKPPHSNIIELSKKDNARENGIIVVRPDIKIDHANAAVATFTPTASQQIITLADAKTPIAPEAKVIHVDGKTPTSRKTGPRFIFDN